ncbi:hypothetical protein H0H92_000146 [Tricholoma furcatifolium]|nr:hypothetical protein H0H92_000146 [Tricholoma furcatifolium]
MARNSILSLFDPLASPAHSRDAPTPDSDKENSSPHTDTDIFGQAIKHPSPVILKHRLIDVGDITIDDPMLTEEKALDESICNEDDTFSLPLLLATTPSRNNDSLHPPPSSAQSNDLPRTPLAELCLDRDISPVARTKMYRRQPPAFASDALPPSGECSSFTSIIDAVTSSGESFAAPPHPSADNDLTNEAQSSFVCDHTSLIALSSVDGLGSSTSTPSLDDPPVLPLGSPPPQSVDTSISHPRATLRPSPRTSSEDRNRHSIDLSTSFHLQLQSEEASFDLLKDKVSFLASIDGMEDDDSFDMAAEEAKLQAAVESITKTEAKATIPLTSEPSVIPAPVFVPPLPKQTPVTVHTPAFQERGQVLPPPIAALKIVKRVTRPGHVKSDSASSTGSTVSEGSIKTSSVPAAYVSQAPRPVTQPAAGNNINPFASNSSAAPAASTSLRTGSGPQRVPVLDKQIATSNRRASMQLRSAPQNITTGPRRVLVAPPAPASNPPPVPASNPPPASTSSKTAQVSGLKAPAKYGAGAGIASGMSALPRPTSRLPTAAVSGLVRPRPVVGASAAGTGSVGSVKRTSSVRRAL